MAALISLTPGPSPASGRGEWVGTAAPLLTLCPWRLSALLILWSDTGTRSAVLFTPRGGCLAPYPRRLS